MIPQDQRGWLALLGRWLGGTMIGWVAGVFGAIVLSDLVVNLFYPKETNLIVGLCIGVAAAWGQKLAVAPWMRLSVGWVVGGGIIMGPPFIAAVAVDELSLDPASLPVETAMGAIGVLGGLLGAVLQAQSLRESVSRGYLWVGATAVSWGLALMAAPRYGILGIGVVVAVASGVLFVLVARTAEEPAGG